MAWLLRLLRTPLVWIASRLTLRSTYDPGATTPAAPLPLSRPDDAGLRVPRVIPWVGLQWPLALELLGIGLWAAWVGRTYLDFNPHTWPSGGEFAMSTQGHIVWTWLTRCGDCVLWNGALKGGSPALIDLHSAVTHPLVVLTTVLWGAVVGAELTLVICLFLGGLAQWWLARTLGLGRFARLWSAALAVVAGHLSGRMEIGVFGVVLSTAFGSLAMVAGLALARDGRRSSAVRLAVLLALTIMAGQGYIQLGLLVALLPAFGVLLVNGQLRARPVWREFAVAGGLALLLSAVFLVPVLHFWPELAKDTDPTFDSAQPIEYGPLNLIIHDAMFYRTEALEKQPYPYLYVNYIGWLPILFALAALRLVPQARAQQLLFFLVAIALIYLASSAAPFQLLEPLAPEFMTGVRNPPLIAGLAVPLILGLAAWGLDLLLRSDGLQVVLALRGAQGVALNVTWLLVLAALWAIAPVYHFNKQWLTTSSADPVARATMPYLAAPGAHWVQTPYGEGFWLPELLAGGAKIADVTRPWNWRGRDNPTPAREITRDPGRAATGVIEGQNVDLLMVARPDVHYAAVAHGDVATPCTAEALGGHIDVVCEAAAPGVLVVREHTTSGWQATVDGTPAELTGTLWLELPTAAGRHQYSFRYRPWDVPAGALLTLVGLALAWWYGAAPAPAPAAAADAGTPPAAPPPPEPEQGM